MAEHDKISEYRSEVVDKHVTTDYIVSVIIGIYYFGELRNDFISDVLFTMTQASRINILGRILKTENINDRGLVKNLEKMNRIRNRFAHCSDKIRFGEMYGYAFNPKDMFKEINFEKEYKDFSECYEEAFTILVDIGNEVKATFSKKGIQRLNVRNTH